MFERGEAYSLVQPRVQFVSNAGFALDNAQRYKIGSYIRHQGTQLSLSTQNSATVLFTITTTETVAFNVGYTFKDTNTGIIRTGTLNIAAQDTDDSPGTLTYTDEYVENNPPGLVLVVTQSGSTISVKYTLPSGALSTSGTFAYSISNLL
jgi:hypothetical protein